MRRPHHTGHRSSYPCCCLLIEMKSWQWVYLQCHLGYDEWWHHNWQKIDFLILRWNLHYFVTSQKLTEQRVPVFSHEIVPDHLRTKPDPEVEEQEKHLSAEAARIGPEVAQVNKHMMSVEKHPNNHSEHFSILLARCLHPFKLKSHGPGIQTKWGLFTLWYSYDMLVILCGQSRQKNK